MEKTETSASHRIIEESGLEGTSRDHQDPAPLPLYPVLDHQLPRTSVPHNSPFCQHSQYPAQNPKILTSNTTAPHWTDHLLLPPLFSCVSGLDPSHVALWRVLPAAGGGMPRALCHHLQWDLCHKVPRHDSGHSGARLATIFCDLSRPNTHHFPSANHSGNYCALWYQQLAWFQGISWVEGHVWFWDSM